jgi:cob(I)alamin adenosyltransferase
MKKSSIYTKKGDQGTTSLVGGKKVLKTNPRLESYGTTDELNSFIGLLAAEIDDPANIKTLRTVQNLLFNIGASLATDVETPPLEKQSAIDPKSIARLEKEIDRIDAGLPEMKDFILPGGNRPAALAHVCRSVCRRAERQIFRLHQQRPVDETILAFINRLSDYFFVLARFESLKNGGEEIIWDNTCN